MSPEDEARAASWFGTVELIPGPKCPNCLEDDWLEGVVEPLPHDRHWVTETVVDGIEQGDWTCKAAPDEELEAAGYLVHITLLPGHDDDCSTMGEA